MIEVEEVCNYNFIKLNIKFFERLNFHARQNLEDLIPFEFVLHEKINRIFIN